MVSEHVHPHTYYELLQGVLSVRRPIGGKALPGTLILNYPRGMSESANVVESEKRRVNLGAFQGMPGSDSRWRESKCKVQQVFLLLARRLKAIVHLLVQDDMARGARQRASTRSL